MSRFINPWEIGGSVDDSKSKTFSDNFPALLKGKFLLVKIAAPKEKTVRDGLVATFLMTSYFDETGKEIKTIEAQQAAEGYKITFPLGKRGLHSTKYRGPKSFNKWKINGEDYIITADQFTIESAIDYCQNGKNKIPNWNELSEVEKEVYIDQYYYDMYLLALSQDLVLPLEDNGFTAPTVGMLTTLYRVSEPPIGDSKWPRVTITKWHKGMDSLDGTIDELPPTLATSIYEEWMRRDNPKSEFDPTSFVEE